MAEFPLALFCKIAERVVVQDIRNRVPDVEHDVLDGTGLFTPIGVRTVMALLIGRLADAADRRQRTVEEPDDLPQRDLLWRFDEAVSAAHPPAAGQEPGILQREKDLLEKFDGDVLPASDVVALDQVFAVLSRQFDEGPERVLTFLGKTHVELIAKDS